MLRDLIAVHPALRPVPVDVNYVWRLGSEKVPHDELRPDDLRPGAATRIRHYLARFSRDGSGVVEKTVSNSLRVSYVRRVLPDARFIHIYRDGRDVVASAYQQWTSAPDWRYVVRKLRYYPFLLAPAYALRQALALPFRGRQQAPTMPVWGPAYRGIHRDLTDQSLLEVCSRQWVRCVQRAADQLPKVPSHRLLNIRYENFVAEPGPHLVRLAAFLDVDPEPYRSQHLALCVTATRVARYAQRLNALEARDVERFVLPGLERVATLQDTAT